MGDAFISTDNPVLLRNTKKLRPLMCEQKSTDKKVITEALLRKANKQGFGNDVGSITNRCTAMFDVLAKFEKGTSEYEEMMYRITSMQGYQQECIDSCKGIIPKKMPKSWYDAKGLEGRDLELVSNKKPYFFIYNYRHIKSKYLNYVKNCDDSCKIKFGIGIKELLKKENPTEEESVYIDWYYRKCPITDNDSIMNRICHRLEDKFEDLSYHVKNGEDFDKSILMTKKSIKRSLVKDVLAVYEEYKAEIYNNMKNKVSSEEYSQEMLIRKYEEKIFNICNNVEDLANILISELYDTANNKQFIWAIVGDYLVEKLLKDNNYEIQYPVEDKNGSIEWNGTKYSIIKEGVDELC